MEPEDDAAVIAKLWTDYKDTGSREARDRLIVHYSPLVKYVAGRVSAANVSWAVDASGQWTTAANWSSSPSLPGAADSGYPPTGYPCRRARFPDPVSGCGRHS